MLSSASRRRGPRGGYRTSPDMQPPKGDVAGCGWPVGSFNATGDVAACGWPVG